MLVADVVIAGSGAAGLLLANGLPSGLRVILVGPAAMLPRRKYWLTGTHSANANPTLTDCIDSRPDVLDFIAVGVRLTAMRTTIWFPASARLRTPRLCQSRQ